MAPRPTQGSPDPDWYVRLARLEVRVEHVDEKVDDRIEEAIRTQAIVEHSWKQKHEMISTQLSETNKQLSSINTKMAVHTFIFTLLATVAGILGAAYAKALFDRIGGS